MLIDRKSWPWLTASVALLAVSTFGYWRYAHRVDRLSGGTTAGLVFGIAGSAIIVFCMLLSLRKAFRTAPLGRTRFWMQAHVWLGLISYPLIWYHAAFRTGGRLTTILMVLFTLVWLSGLLGLWMQNVIPSNLLRTVPGATIREQIPTVIARMRLEAEAVVEQAIGYSRRAMNGHGKAAALPTTGGSPAGPGASAAGKYAAAASVSGFSETAGPSAAVIEATTEFRDFYLEHVDPVLTVSHSDGSDASAGPRLASLFLDARRRLPERFAEPLASLEDLVFQRLQFERQRRLHRILHAWLLVHVPLSWAMTILSVVHAIAALRYATLR